MSRLTDARSELERYEKTKPADYQSQYQGQIKDVMGQLDGMGEFDYDPDADAAYQQYKSQYTRSAKLANQNAQANAVQNAEKQDYQNYQNDYSNWLNGLQYRQNQYNSASSEHQQRTSNVLNGILSAVGLAAQILPWFFV